MQVDIWKVKSLGGVGGETHKDLGEYVPPMPSNYYFKPCFRRILHLKSWYPVWKKAHIEYPFYVPDLDTSF